MTSLEIHLTDWSAIWFMVKYFGIGAISTLIATRIFREFKKSKEEDSNKAKWNVKEKKK